VMEAMNTISVRNSEAMTSELLAHSSLVHKSQKREHPQKDNTDVDLLASATCAQHAVPAIPHTSQKQRQRNSREK
jgi:hypothetical protein